MSPSRSIFTRLLSALLFLALSSQFSNVHAADPKLSPRALRSKAETAASKGEMNTAIHFYSALIDAEKSQINYFHRANLYLKRHQYAHALSDLREAIELDPKFLKGRMLRAKIFKVTGQCDKALTELKDILAQQATHKEATTELPKVQTCVQLVQQANAMLASQQWESAKHFLTQALDIAYESNILLSSRVRCHASLRDWQSVIVDTRRILQSTKTDMDALYLRGQAYYYLGEHESALTHWKEGLRLDPEHKLTKEATKKLRLLVRRIANAEASLNSNPQEAMEDIDLALEMDPHHTEIRPGLKLKKCEALKNLKRWKELIDLATELIEADENSIEAWIKRAEGKMGLEEWEQAIHDYTKATQLNNGHQGAQQGLHQAQVELKKSQQKDFYKELGIPRNANARQIKKAYRKLAMIWHPDKHVNDADKDTAAKKFQAIAEAYEVLSDPEIRGKYDRGEEWKPNQGGGQQQHHGHPFHFQQGFGGGHGFHQQHHFRWG